MTTEIHANPNTPAHPLAEPFEAPDYEDRFVLQTKGTAFADIDDFVAKLALGQPGWLVRVSMGIRHRRVLEQALAAGPLDYGDALGNWQVVNRGPDHVTFAEDMGFMAYRLTYRYVAGDQITAETEVRQSSRLIGPFYWRFATPLHCRFLTRMLMNAAVEATATVTQEPRQ